jgi:hypothetical protein
MRQFAKMAMMIAAISTSAFAQQKRVEMGWTGENGYFERQSPSAERAFSFYTSGERQQEFLRAEADYCTDASACGKRKVKVSREDLGSLSDKSIFQIIYALESQNNPVSQHQPYWKSIVIETRPGMYRELLLLKNEGEFWVGPPSTAEILNAGTTKLLVTKDKTTSRDMWCSGEFWVLGEPGATLADFTEVTAAVHKAIPKGAQDITPMCAAVNLRAFEFRSDVQRVNPECAACGLEGHVVVKFKFEGQRAVPISTDFSSNAP